jgi:hypothetical protein
MIASEKQAPVGDLTAVVGTEFQAHSGIAPNQQNSAEIQGIDIDTEQS